MARDAPPVARDDSRLHVDERRVRTSLTDNRAGVAHAAVRRPATFHVACKVPQAVLVAKVGRMTGSEAAHVLAGTVEDRAEGTFYARIVIGEVLRT